MASWRYALGSAIGTSHVRSGDPCQDAALCELVPTADGREVLVAIAADGAGSARLSHVGAAAAVRCVADALRRHVEAGLDVAEVSREVAVGMVLGARDRLLELAEEHGTTVRDLACTLLVAVVADEVAAYFQVGDGALVVSSREDPGGYGWVFWPERGEYANTTAFITDIEVADHLMHEVARGPIDELAVFTDGIQALVLDYRAQAVHSPFFRKMLAPLRSIPERGQLASLSAALAAYLDSAPVNERTDDDKTLVLATRREP